MRINITATGAKQRRCHCKIMTRPIIVGAESFLVGRSVCGFFLNVCDSVILCILCVVEVASELSVMSLFLLLLRCRS